MEQTKTAVPNMISIVPGDLQPRDVYRLLISSVVPRPIGWVSTIGLDGTLNLATILISVGQRKGDPKDTFRNIQDTGEFVVNIVNEELATAMNETAGEWEYHVNEFERAGVTAVPSIDVKPPRVAESPIAMEVKMTQIIPVDDTHYTLILGRVVRFHIREGLRRSNGLIDATLLKPLARLGGDEYATIHQVFEMKRP